MTSITVTPQPDKGRVRIDLDWTSLFSGGVTVSKCLVYRVIPGLYPVSTLIREGDPCILSNLKATIYDWEFPLDTPVYYQATVYLNPNGDFEDTVEGWTGAPAGLSTGGAATRSTDYFYAGSASLKWAPNGSASAPLALSDPWFAVVGTSYTFNAQVLAAKAWAGGVGLVINWYTGGGAFISQSGSASNLWPSVGLWEAYTLTATAPATAVFGRAGLLFAGTPPTDRVFYLDEAYVTTAGGTIDTSATPIVMQSENGGWWKDPLHPATMVRIGTELEFFTSGISSGTVGVALVGVGRPTHPADQAVLEVPSQTLGVASWSPRKAARRPIQVATATFADADQIRDLHSSNAPLLLQLPARYGVPEEYSLCEDLTATALGGNMAIPVQLHATQMAHVQNPPGPAEGVLGARYMDLRVKGVKLTYSAANSAGYTWLDALKGNIS